MSLEELLTSYMFCDGHVLGFEFDYSSRIWAMRFRGRKWVTSKKYQDSIAILRFGGVQEIDMFEDFPTNGGCTDVTLTKTGPSSFYLSLDPYGNSGLPHEQDNWIVKAASLTFIDEDGNSHPID